MRSMGQNPDVAEEKEICAAVDDGSSKVDIEGLLKAGRLMATKMASTDHPAAVRTQ